MDQTFGWWFYFTCECGAFPMLTPTENIDTEKWPPSLFKQYVSKHTECRESYIPSRKVRHQWRVCFQSLCIKICLDSKMWDFLICPQDLNSRVWAVCFLARSGPHKHILMAYWDCQRGNRWKECFWECWCHTVFTQSRSHSIQDGTMVRSGQHKLASEIWEGGSKLALSILKQQ